MTDAIITAAIAGSAAALAAAVTAIAATFASRQKLRELDIEYQQRLQDNYLASARQYTNSIYAPLCIAVTILDDEFESFRAMTNLDKSEAPEDALNRIAAAISKFVSFTCEKRSEGASAFLTTALDARLRSFVRFIDASLTANEPVVRAVIRFWGGRVGYQKRFLLRGRSSVWWRTPRVDFGIIGLGVSFEADEILAAPLASRQFASRFATDVASILESVKEVTLGSLPKG